MTISVTAAGADADRRDRVVAELGGYGVAIDCTGVSKLALDGRNVLWLVTAGALDLFAVDADEAGRWHFLGRLEPGSILPGAVKGPKHTLVGRPLAGCALRRLRLGEVIRAQRDEWVHQRPVGGGQSPQEQAVSAGVDLGLRVLLEPATDRLPPREFVPLEPGQDAGLDDGVHGRSVDGIVWVEVVSGRVRLGTGVGETVDREAGDLLTIGEKDWITAAGDEAVVRVRATAGLHTEDRLWPNLLNHQARFLYTLDRWIERLDRTYDERMQAGREAGNAVREAADRSLLDVIQVSNRRGDADAAADSDDAVLAVARLVAAESRIAVAPPGSGETPDRRVSLLSQVAARSRFRTRGVELEDNWWRDNVGPLAGRLAGEATPVALLWRRGRYQVVDPASGRRWRVTASTADQVDRSAVMFYRPLPERPVGALRLIAFGFRGNGVDLRNMLVGGLAAVALGALVPVATGQILGVFVPNADRDLIVQLCLALVAAGVAAAAFALLENVAILRVEGRMDAILQSAIWDRLIRLPTTFFAGRSTGELAGGAMGIYAIRQALSGVTAIVAQAVIIGIVNFALLLYYDVLLGLVAGGVVALSAVVFLGLGARQLRWQRQFIELQNKLNNRAYHTLRGLPKLRVAAAESFAYADWVRDFVRSRDIERRIGRIQNLITVVNRGYVPACTLLLFVLLAGPARGSLTVSEFLAFSVAVTMMLTAVAQLTGAITAAGTVLPLYQQLKPVLREVPEVQEASTVPGELSGEIEVSHLSFSYAEDGPLVLDDVSFHVLPGEFVAIVGGSGCGKSTLLRLLVGFNEPTAGSVLYDGQDFSSLDRTAVRRQCGVVLQNGQPFNGEIIEILCGTERFTLDEAWEAAEMAGLSGDLAQMPMGMNTVITDGGSNLSGGQRQRLMIAQALIRKPRILFFDEATSALDNETQRIVTESTRKLNATRIVIAHRLSTVLDADRIVVMDAGRILQQGPPAELLTDTDGLFYQLVRRQVA